MISDEVSNSVLCLQSTQRLRHRLVVDGCEVEGRLKLACLHVVDKRRLIGCSRVSDAVAPDGIEMLWDAGSKSSKIVVQLTVAVGFKDKIFRFEMFFARGHADVDHIVHDNEPGEMG